MMRLDKFLSMYTGKSRRQLKALVKSAGVDVNGTIIRDASRHIDPTQDDISFLGQTFIYRYPLVIMMNKPAGVLSATKDDRRTTAIDLIGPEYPRFSLHIAGRLDIDAEGFLLLTNDGSIVHDVISPKKHIDKTYVATLDRKPADPHVLLEGITIRDGKNKPYQAKAKHIEWLRGRTYKLTIDEGKHHQVKRMFSHTDATVKRLKRIAIGGVMLDEELDPGECRMMERDEIKRVTG